MAKFQMINSTNPNTIAVVLAEGDISGFRQNPEWYEMTEQNEIKEAKEAEVKPPQIKRTVKKETA